MSGFGGKLFFDTDKLKSKSTRLENLLKISISNLPFCSSFTILINAHASLVLLVLNQEIDAGRVYYDNSCMTQPTYNNKNQSNLYFY